MSEQNISGKFIFVQFLTLVRVPLIFVFLIINLLAAIPIGSMWFSVAFIAMLLSAVTDLFDGYFARKFHVTSRLGAYVDPLTDKMFYLVALPTLVLAASSRGEHSQAQVLLVTTILFLMRDQWVSFLRSIGALHGVDSKANWSGKARTLVAFPMICIVYYYLAAPKPWWPLFNGYVVYFLEAASIIINLVSIWVYTAHFWPSLKKEFGEGE